MARRFGRTSWAWSLLACLSTTVGADEPGGVKPLSPDSAPARAVAPATPELPTEVVSALQEGRHADARAAVARIARDAKPDDRAYYAWISGVAARLAGDLDGARTGLSAALEAAPKGPWAAKIRHELAAVELRAGRFDAAEALARVDAESLLAADRKDRLAGVFHAFARGLLAPDDPVTPPDPEGAYALLDQARQLAKGGPLRSRLLAAMGRASQAAGNQDRAIGDYQKYLDENSEGAERAEVRFRLGEAQLAAGRPDDARRAWSDLARDLEGEDDPGGFRPKALYQVAATHGMPTPPDDARLNLGVAALRRFLAAAPGHELAPRAAYEIGAAYLHRGRTQEALAAFQAFLKGENFRAEGDRARRDLADLAMTAAFQVGEVLRQQGKFDRAIDAWKEYLAKYPDGPQSADAQRAILDTRLLIAADLLRREQFAEARAAWEEFVADNPLDPRVPQILFDLGQSHATQGHHAEAVAAWETLLGKFPGTEPAAHAEFAIADALEIQKGDPAAAIERFKKVAVEPWLSQARQRIAVMEAKALVVVTPRAFRSGEMPLLEITSRNLETLTFTAYKLNPEAYFRKKHALERVEALDIGLVAPDAEWTVPVPDYAKYKPVESKYELPKLEVPGVYVVKVSDEKALQATTLVLGSDVDAIVKASRDQVLVFAQDMKTGKGRAGARVLVSDGQKVVLDARTGDDGVLLTDWPEPRDPGAGLHYLVLDGRDVAGSGLGLPGQVAQGLEPRAYLDTDRPAYRPGQEVALRGVVREVEGGQYAAPAGQSYRLDVSDSRGRLILSKPVKLSEYGTFHDRLGLDSSAPEGAYSIRLHRPGGSEFSGQFVVQSYKLEKLALAIDMPRTVFFRGETISGKVEARYQYGAPASGRPVEVRLPGGRTASGTTDADGNFPFEFATDEFAEEATLPVVALLPEDNASAAVNLRLAVRAFSIEQSTARTVYLDGESFPLDLSTRDASGEPTGQELTVAVLKVVQRHGLRAESEVSRATVATDPETGKATITLQVDDPEGGQHVIRVSGTDRFGNPVVSDRMLTISGREDRTKLRILADRQDFKVGETARVNLHARGGGGTALVAWEADRVLSYRLVTLGEGDNPLAWEVEGPQFPNFSLSAARMAGDRFDQARLDVRVARDLRVTVKPVKPSVGPGEPVEVEITAADQLGRPVAAELSLAAVDRALLRRFGDRLPPIGPFFYGQSRTGAFATEATNTFRYAPATQPVPEAVVEEEGRAAALAREATALDFARRRGRELLSAAPAAPSPAAAAGDAAIVGRLWAEGQQGQSGPGGQPGQQAGFDGPADQKLLEYDIVREDRDRAALQDGEWHAGFRFQMNLGFRGAGNARAEQYFKMKEARSQYVETAYWNPSVVTGADGKARVTFPAPPALSEYELKARGVTGADTLVGQATATVVVKKDFFVELKAPSIVTQGDRPRFSARVHHLDAEGTAEVRLSAYAGERESVDPKRVELKGSGVAEVLFDPFEVPAGDVVRLGVSAKLGDKSDELVVEVPIRPWGVEALASASGTASSDATALVGLPEGREYESPEMLIVVAPTMRRLLVELALGRDAYALSPRFDRCILPPPPDTTADRASSLLAAASALSAIRQAGGAPAPEATRLGDRARGLASELISLQNDDGGWPWVAPAEGTTLPGDRLTSARAFWALAEAERLGLLPDASALEKGAAFLSGQFAQIDAGDAFARAAVLHALSTRNRATFEAANSLNRLRQSLPDSALGYLALTLANLDRPALAGEVLDLLAARAKSEPAGPGLRPRTYWSADGHSPQNPVETTALAALAFARARPQAPQLAGATDWLLAHRVGTGWQPSSARGAAVAALAAAGGPDRAEADRYRLVVTVNDEEVARIDAEAAAEGRAIAVPAAALKAGGENRVKFDIEGRGTFGYAVTLAGFTRDFGPDQDPTGKNIRVDHRLYLPAEPTLDGRALPTGFGSVVDPKPFRNTTGQVALGGRAIVEIQATRFRPDGRPAWEDEYLVVEDFLPAGATLVEGSIQSQAHAHEVGDGVIRFYYAPGQYPGTIRYELAGYLPGRYRALPPRIRDLDEPGRYHLGQPADLHVLDPGARPTDPYRPTPDELYERGKRLFDAGRLAEAAGPLGELADGYTLRPDVAREVARMLLKVHIREYQPRMVVRSFEILKERAPDLVIPFDDILVVGRAYRDIGEHERAYLVWKATAEASYLEDARVGEVLRQRGRILEGVATLLDLWREYPETAAIEADFFALSQLLAVQAGKAISDPALRAELASAGVTRPDMLLQSIRLVRAFLSQSPANPMADEASLALVGAYLDLEDFESVVALAERFARLFPKSKFLDGFQFSEALGRFQLGQYDRAIATAETIAAATYKDEAGVEQPSPNKWEAIYILGQIHDARRQPAKALEYYRQVDDRFTDAAGAVKALTRKALALPEVTVIRPEKPEGEPGVKLGHRNIAEVDVKVYPVDLMRLYLTRRNLDAIAGIDLAGITPTSETAVKLGDGQDFADRDRPLDLPVEKEGAYLVMARGDDLYASGIALVTPLKLEVLEDAAAGRVRVTVRDAKSDDPVPKVQVKVIGTANPAFLSGQTDLRGVYVAEGVRGQVTAVARKGANQYAFYRGTTVVGEVPLPRAARPQASKDEMADPEAVEAESLDKNLKELNSSNRLRQLERLENRYNLPAAPGVQVQEAR